MGREGMPRRKEAAGLCRPEEEPAGSLVGAKALVMGNLGGKPSLPLLQAPVQPEAAFVSSPGGADSGALGQQQVVGADGQQGKHIPLPPPLE